ncbi:MAG: cell division protein FtsA [Rickettsiales bacterium]
MTASPEEIVAALDVGHVKTACLIARITASGEVTVCGAAQQLSRGISAGYVVDAQKAEDVIRAVVASAEKMAGVNVNEVVLAISGNRQASRRIVLQHEINDAVTSGAMHRMLERGCKRFDAKGRILLHGVPLDFAIDGNGGIREPVGMHAGEITADMHLLDADASTVANLASILARCHLDMRDAVSAPYAAGLACMTEAEREAGALAIDFGGGNTSVALFKNGALHYVDSFALGAAHVTRDVSIGLCTSPENAERLKTLYGSVSPSHVDDYESVEFVHNADVALRKSDPTYAPRSQLVSIIQSRIEEIIDILLSRLPTGLKEQAPSGAVLTGGGACLTGLCDYVSVKTGMNARIGRPGHCAGLPESMGGPIFSTPVGVLRYYVYRRKMLALHLKEYHRQKRWYERAWGWMRDNI